MGDAFVMSSRQASELDFAFERNGWTPADVKKLSVGDMLAQVLPVVRGSGKVEIVRHIIDCDANPFTPNSWKVEEHRKGGELTWNPTKVNLHLSPNQIGDKVIRGDKLRKELASEPVLNANVLDYLLAHPNLIPEEWKGKAVFFWGTIYRVSDGNLYVRYVYFLGGRWRWDYRWLDRGWRVGNPAARLAS
ncbi:MAG: hypothetical protein AAB482_02965 [Patescibacteria group bacterium]